MYHNIPPFPQKPKQCHGIHGVSRILSELRRRLRRLRLRLSLQALVRWMKNDSTCFNKFIEGKIYNKPYGFKIFTIKFIGFSDVFLQKKKHIFHIIQFYDKWNKIGIHPSAGAPPDATSATPGREWRRAIGARSETTYSSQMVNA